MSFLYKNNAISRLKVDHTAAALTLTVLDGEGAKFPLPTGGDFFFVTLDDRRSGQIEICKCTARSGDVLTVLRAQEGTIAQDFAKDATVANRFTAGTLDIILATAGYTKGEADAKFVDTAGDTMTGPLVLPAGSPPSANAATNKGYVDAQIATRAPEAPSDGSTYGRHNAAWVAVVRTIDYTAADVLAKLITVDGAGSGLDADLLDGNQGSFYAQASTVAAILVNKADLTSPTFTGDPKAPTPVPGDNDTSIATTAFVTDAVSGKLDSAVATATFAPLASPTFTGDPKAPTPAPGDADTSIATTAFVTNAVSAAISGGGYAPLASPNFSGNPTAPTPTAGDNDTSIATTAFVTGAVAAEATARTNADALKLDSATAATTYAPIASPTFTGDPKAPTPATADNDTSIATTGFVKAQGYATVAYVDAKPAGAVISDTPPATPSQGQTWWESDSGAFFIWYNDGNTSQWVQVNGPMPGAGDAPQDGGEYVRVNGVWRLKSQGLTIGPAAFNIAVPNGARHAKLVGRMFGTVSGLNPVLRLSMDGSTYQSGASDYIYMGQALYTGSSGNPTKITPVTASFFPLGGYTDQTGTPIMFEIDLMVGKVVGQGLAYRSRTWSYHSAATAGSQEYMYAGYSNGAWASPAQVMGIQLTTSAADYAAGSYVNVQWMY